MNGVKGTHLWWDKNASAIEDLVVNNKLGDASHDVVDRFEPSRNPDRATARCNSVRASAEVTTSTPESAAISAPDSGSATTSFTSADVSRYAITSAVVLAAHLVEDVAEGPPRSWFRVCQRLHRKTGWTGLPRRDEIPERVVVGRQRTEHRDRAPVLSDGQGLASGNPPQVHAEMLPELPYADPIHVAHGSTIRAGDLDGA